ncbi:hypothetical protein UCDDA912_g09215 [Diaporthe ampelina]|uniref:LysM domain-containing protein n=1 Tax=Diaporthe ampelina TaxID=1214573 RepID=A0A0G2F9I1_9PEZI|nr:hypothetical protein UCDDA912_g09215 [Diaporthe ampelina]
MAPNCNKFVFVRDGDGFCGDIAKRAGITTSDFYKWNAGVGDGCQNLWLDTNYCVGLIGNGVVTPSPTQAGIAPNCNKFVLVKEGDGFCDDIARKAGISSADFYKWNSGVGTDCKNLWLDTYYCVGLVGATPTTPPPTTTTTLGNGVTTPTPIQDGMVSSCRKFHFVVSLDTCATLAKQYSITEADFYKWNPAVNSGGTCKSLWLETYVCVALVKMSSFTEPIPRSILVFGAAGHVARPLAAYLARGAIAIKLRLATISPNKEDQLRSAFPSAEIVEANYSDVNSLSAAVDGIEGVFVITPAGMSREPAMTDLVTALKRAGSVVHVTGLMGALPGFSPARIHKNLGPGPLPVEHPIPSPSASSTRAGSRSRNYINSGASFIDNLHLQMKSVPAEKTLIWPAHPRTIHRPQRHRQGRREILSLGQC